MVECYTPETLDAALEICAEHQVIPFAGGTDLMVLKSRQNESTPVFENPPLFLHQLSELQHISEQNNEIHIGAGVNLNDLLNSEIIPQIFKTIILRMAAHPTRNLATIGGNICNASPAGDTLPYLYAVDATLVLQSVTGERSIPVADFITGPGETSIRQDELLTEIIIPRKEFSVTFYKKVGTRKGLALSKVSFLGLADIQSSKLTDLRLTFGAVAPTVIHSREIEQLAIGKSVEEVRANSDSLLEKYSSLIQPIDDARSTKIYRKKVSLNLLDYFITSVLDE